MIKNERQLMISRAELEKFKTKLQELKEKYRNTENNKLLEIEINAVETQISELEENIKDYNEIWNSNKPVPTLRSVEEIPQAFIKARLSLGLTQKEFAELVDLHEQQIQRYEATGYETANLSRLMEFAKVLNVSLPSEVRLPSTDITLKQFYLKMRKAGINNSLLNDRLLPANIISNRHRNATVLSNIGIQTVGLIGRIFGWSPSEIIQSRSLNIDTRHISPIRFKVNKNINQKQVTAYTSYANYLVDMIVKATSNISQKEITSDPILIHNEIRNKYGDLSIKNVLNYIWSLGVPVISVNDPGGFQGAHFRKNNKSVIFLNHRTESKDLWLFSLFHELWHVIVHQNGEESFVEYMDFEDLLYKGVGKDEEELRASRFASTVLLGRIPQELINETIALADRDLFRLKQATIAIANKYGISQGVLANYIAFRLQNEGESWWATAQTLQDIETDIQLIATEVLLDHIDLSTISGMDLDLLRRALNKT